MSKTIKEWQEISHQIAVEHGWWKTERSIPEHIALFHSELSEALEEVRNGHNITEPYWSDTGTPISMTIGTHTGKPEGFPIELADLLIRIFDVTEFYGIDLETALEIKTEYNKSRSYRHGGKLL